MKHFETENGARMMTNEMTLEDLREAGTRFRGTGMNVYNTQEMERRALILAHNLYEFARLIDTCQGESEDTESIWGLLKDMGYEYPDYHWEETVKP